MYTTKTGIWVGVGTYHLVCRFDYVDFRKGIFSRRHLMILIHF